MGIERVQGLKCLHYPLRGTPLSALWTARPIPFGGSSSPTHTIVEASQTDDSVIHQKLSYISSDRDLTQYPYNAKPKTPDASKQNYAVSRTCGFAASIAFAAGLCAAASVLPMKIFSAPSRAKRLQAGAMEPVDDPLS